MVIKFKIERTKKRSSRLGKWKKMLYILKLSTYTFIQEKITKERSRRYLYTLNKNKRADFDISNTFLHTSLHPTGTNISVSVQFFILSYTKKERKQRKEVPNPTWFSFVYTYIYIYILRRNYLRVARVYFLRCFFCRRSRAQECMEFFSRPCTNTRVEKINK